MAQSENKRRMLNGELYHAFTPELNAERARCNQAINRYRDARNTTRRQSVQFWRE